ncbi:hypothetical protein [Micromonospora craniellae]|uniref:WD40 repeat domain-containing protein n=2 Tax=Micromonospora craniellae TaxID=2294034 RepID=A0A372FXX7_9ACTN|nr:hypothetical protein [Micromonospora craniellae]QOC93791.1 hypothetical protein ID554_09250 [Micromonospora craniellae]RFS45661.1 hypothetical protein D0Q02_15075 [Micromonospora craniellae]
MSQDELERAVRETFSRQVATPCAPRDPASALLRRAHRVQRRRTLAGMSLAASAIVLVSAGAMQLREDRPPTGADTVVIADPNPAPDTYRTSLPPPGPSTETPLAEVDLVLGRTIATAQGRRVPLLGTGAVQRVHRLTDGRGWLAVGEPSLSGRSLWAVAPDGTARMLLAGAAEIVLDRHGRQVAWKQDRVLAAAGIANGVLISTVRAEAPATAVPLRFVDGAVLVRLDPDLPGHVLWPLRPGLLDEGTDRTSLRVFGALPDGRLVGEVPAGLTEGTCLTLLDPADVRAPEQPACGPAIGGDGVGAVSPDGRWLLVNGRAGKQDSALLVDLTRLDPSVPAHPAGPPMNGTVSWNRPDVAHYADAAGALVRVDAERVSAGRPAVPVTVAGLRRDEPLVVVTGG